MASNTYRIQFQRPYGTVVEQRNHTSAAVALRTISRCARRCGKTGLVVAFRNGIEVPYDAIRQDVLK